MKEKRRDKRQKREANIVLKKRKLSTTLESKKKSTTGQSTFAILSLMTMILNLRVILKASFVLMMT